MRARVIWFSERRVIDPQRPGNFLLASFFCWNWKNSLTAHSQIATTISNHSHPPIQPIVSLLEKLWIGGRRKSGTIRRSGWGLLLQWRSERLVRRLGRGKAEGWGRSWLDGCKIEWCFCDKQHRCALTAYKLPCNSIFMLMSSYLTVTRAYCRFFECLIAFGVRQTSVHTMSRSSLLTKKWIWWLPSSNLCYYLLGYSYESRRSLCSSFRTLWMSLSWEMC